MVIVQTTSTVTKTFFRKSSFCTQLDNKSNTSELTTTGYIINMPTLISGMILKPTTPEVSTKTIPFLSPYSTRDGTRSSRIEGILTTTWSTIIKFFKLMGRIPIAPTAPVVALITLPATTPLEIHIKCPGVWTSIIPLGGSRTRPTTKTVAHATTSLERFSVALSLS